jgi:indolepyruvate ferredoxin oxidoreductase beta subunit
MFSRALATVLVKEGYNVNTYEVLGTAHRGTLVFSFIRLSKKLEAFANLIPPGEADILVGFEPLETLRLGMLWASEDGLVIMNTQRIIPLYESIGRDMFSKRPRPRGYPSNEEIVNFLKSTGCRVITIDATRIAKEVGHHAVMNVVMLGSVAASGLLPVSIEKFKETISSLAPKGTVDLNLQAFDAGIKAFKAVKNKQW